MGISSFEKITKASIAAVEALGPVKIYIVCEAEKRPSGDTKTGTQEAERWTTKVDQLLDAPGRRARLDVHDSSGAGLTVVVLGKERTTIRREGVVSIVRDVSLQEPDGPPLPLWADASSTDLGYADLLAGALPEKSSVDQLADRRWSLSWRRSEEREQSTFTLLLSQDLLPVRIGQRSQVEAHGVEAAFSFSTEYRFQNVSSLPDSAFSIDLPADAQIHTISRRLPVDHPVSQEADWGHYWLGEQVDRWSLAAAWHDSHQTRSPSDEGGEGLDEFILLLYELPSEEASSQRIHVYVRPLRDPGLDDHLEFVEQQVATGGWQRQEVEVAGRPAIVYRGALTDGFDDTDELVYAFLPDALVVIQPPPTLDPQMALDSLRPLV